MRCYICNNPLSSEDTIFNPQIGMFEACHQCLDIIHDTAYSQGFSPDGEPLDDPELEAEFGNGAVETIDPDFQRDDYGDAGDIHYFGGVDDDYA